MLKPNAQNAGREGSIRRKEARKVSEQSHQDASPARMAPPSGPRPTRSRENSAISTASERSVRSDTSFTERPAPAPVREYNVDIGIQWSEKSMDRAPELVLLYKRPSSFGPYGGNCFLKFFRALTSICRNFNKVSDSMLANYRPVTERTEHTLEFVGDLVREYAINLRYGSQTNIQSVVIKTPSGTSLKSHTSVGGKSASSVKQGNTSGKNVLLKEFYEKSFRTLSILQQVMGHFRNIVYNISFTRYAEYDLTEAEAKMVKGKSVVGSCVWMVTFALQQLQDDPDVEMAESLLKTNEELSELAIEFYSLVHLSLHTWNDIVQMVCILERVHKRTEEVFTRQNNAFITKSKPDSDLQNMASMHMKDYRRPPDGDVEELRNFKGFDPYATLLNWGNAKRHGSSSSRILYINDYGDTDNLWNGFDPLTVDRKIPYLKDILNFTKLILENVRESVNKVVVDLQGQPLPDPSGVVMKKPSGRNPTHFTGITNYEAGIDMMDEILTTKLRNVEWNEEEMQEFFETDKIFLDDMDLAALGAGVIRAVLFEARHTLHVCYETCKIMDFREFSTLPSYEKIYYKIKEAMATVEMPYQQPGLGKKLRRSSLMSGGNFEQAEFHMELRNVAGIFRTSPYKEILKKLPIYTNSIGMTLQDPEAVFSPSSEKLLS